MSQTYVLKFAIFVVQGFHNDLHFCNAVVLFYQDRTHKFRDQTESRMTWDVQNWALFLVWKTAKTASALCPKNKPGVALSSYNFPQQIWFVKYERSWRAPHSFSLLVLFEEFLSKKQWITDLNRGGGTMYNMCEKQDHLRWIWHRSSNDHLRSKY